MHAVTHVTHIVDTLHSEDMQLVMSKVVVGFELVINLLHRVTVFQLHIDHTAMNALSQWNGHGQSVLHALLGARHHAVSHRHTRTEVGVAEPLRSKAL